MFICAYAGWYSRGREQDFRLREEQVVKTQLINAELNLQLSEQIKANKKVYKKEVKQ